MRRVVVALGTLALSAGLVWSADDTGSAVVKPPPAAAGKIDFARDVKPILSNNCFACHGPDAAKRRAGLRLDRKEDAFGQLDSGAVAIVPGDPSRSALIERVTTDDEDFRMRHCLGIDHTKLTYRFQGRDFRLTDVHAHVVKDLLV